VTGQVCRGQVSPADREHLRAWLARFAGRDDAAFAVEGCTGWRYVAGELAAAGIAAHLAEPAGTAFARGRKRHARTGKADCRHLRMLLAEGRLPGSHGIIDNSARSVALNPDAWSSRPITASISSSSSISTMAGPSVTVVRASACRISSRGLASASANRE
jgi:hypothetical protein